MRSINLVICLLLFSGACATEYSPWFTPPLEFQGHLGYFYTHANDVQSPLGTFSEPTRNSSAHFGLGVTPWPYWNCEAEIFLTHTTDIAFAYEAALLTFRYAWLDDIQGDCFTLVTGTTLSFVGNRFLHEFAFPYHGTTNMELHATVGKEWRCGSDWHTRFWALAGYGFASRGSAWVHGLAQLEYHLLPCTLCALFSEALYGLGHQDIIPLAPFTGYASIRHQTISLGAHLEQIISCWGTCRLTGWYNVHTRNFINNAWGASLSLHLPFSLI